MKSCPTISNKYIKEYLRLQSASKHNLYYHFYFIPLQKFFLVLLTMKIILYLQSFVTQYLLSWGCHVTAIFQYSI